jgi:aminoglycoside phosphotransferase family enzyme/predicted kinase
MLPDDLLRPDAWPDPRPTPAPIERIETHVSWVLRGETHVLKVKKPVALGFLDFRSIEQRRAACEEEVRLNRRLAPGVYLGVVPIFEGPHGATARRGEGALVDWAVHMTRLDDGRRADALLEARALQASHVDALARRIAELHATGAVDDLEAARWASHAAVTRNVRENFEQTRASVERFVSRGVAEEAEVRQTAFLRRNADRFEARIAAGRVRDGHGDLRLEHVYFEDAGIRVIDCIEFDPRYRIADQCADVAFLAMDLESHGRADLAERFLARYARASDDYDLYAMVDFYAAYRAWVRGKVSAILAQDGGAPSDARRRAEAEARRHFLLAVAASRPALVAPAVVCVGGLIGSGKSTIADAIADELSCPVVDADRTRKHIMGVGENAPLTDPSWRGAYDAATTRAVYGEVLRRAAVVVDSGRSVVIDASFRSRAARGEGRALARARGVPFRFVECQAPAEVCKRRLEARAGSPSQSDGRPEIFDDFAARFEPVDELPAGEHVKLDTARPLEQSLAELRAQLVTWPRGLVA